MTDYELYSLEAFRKHLHDDERPVERASLDTLDPDRLQRYLLDSGWSAPVLPSCRSIRLWRC